MVEDSKFQCLWLSPLITLEQYNNNWEEYNNKLYIKN